MAQTQDDGGVWQLEYDPENNTVTDVGWNPPREDWRPARDYLPSAGDSGPPAAPDYGNNPELVYSHGYNAGIPAFTPSAPEPLPAQAPSFEDWRYGYIPSSAPGLRPPSADYGQDYLTPVLKAYPGISTGAISEMAKVATHEKAPGTMPDNIAGYYWPNAPAGPEIGILPNSPYGLGDVLHEYAHSQDKIDWARDPKAWADFKAASQNLQYGRDVPWEAYAEIARLSGGYLENIPPELRKYYPWLR